MAAVCFMFPPTTGCRIISGLASTVTQNFNDPRPAPDSVANPIRDDVRLSALWVGHSTVLLQIDDRVILTDPFLTDHAAELKIRLVKPGLDLERLPRCNIILLSHSHADHTNLGSLALLENRFPDARLVFPEGVEEFLPPFQFTFVRMKRGEPETDRWIGESRVVDDVKITTVASRHWGGRYGLDGTLWGYGGYTGYIIEYHGQTVYFAGDTGYDRDLFEFIGRTFRIDLALVPIGPTYDPESLGQPMHIFARGALKVLEDTRAALMIPIHFGTTNEPFDTIDPRAVLTDLLQQNPEVASRVRILNIGEQAILKKKSSHDSTRVPLP